MEDDHKLKRVQANSSNGRVPIERSLATDILACTTSIVCPLHPCRPKFHVNKGFLVIVSWYNIINYKHSATETKVTSSQLRSNPSCSGESERGNGHAKCPCPWATTPPKCLPTSQLNGQNGIIVHRIANQLALFTAGSSTIDCGHNPTKQAVCQRFLPAFPCC